MPSSTLPTRPTAPALNRSCSPSVVLPAPAWPARTTLRRWGRSTLLVVMGRLDPRSIEVVNGRVGGPGGGPAILVRYTPRPMSGHSKWSTIKRRRASRTPSAARSSPRSPGRSASPRARAAATPTPTTDCASRSRRRARSTCPPDNIKRTIDKATRRRRGRAVRGDRLRGLRPGRRGDPRRGGDRQPQPDRRGGPRDLHQGRRAAGRLRRGGLAVRAARADHDPVERPGRGRRRAGGDRRGGGRRRHDGERDGRGLHDARRAASRSARRSIAPACRSRTPRTR